MCFTGVFWLASCWRRVSSSEERNTINKLIRKAGSIIGVTPDSLDVVLD